MTMKTRWIGVSLAAFAITVSASAGEAPANLEGFWLCQNNRATTTAPLYVSKLFEANGQGNEVHVAYKKMLAAKYGVTDEVSCSIAYKGPGIREKLEGDNARWFQQIRASGAKVVETGWAYGAETKAASPAVAPGTSAVASAAPAATQKTYQCWMTGFGGHYMTPAFASSKEPVVLSADWRAYMTKAHPADRLIQGQCMEIDPKQAASNLAQAGRKRVDWQE